MPPASSPRPPAALTRADYDRYLPLVRRIAGALARRGPAVALADLLAYGWVGLLEARRRKPQLAGEEFEAYASQRVRGAILDHLRVQDPSRRRARRIWSDTEARPRLVSLEAIDSVEAPTEAPDEETGRRRAMARLASAIEALPPRLQRVLRLSFQEDCALKEIGSLLGVTESRASQLRSEALRQLREAGVETGSLVG